MTIKHMRDLANWDWNPGSDEALDRGCTCDPRENCRGDGDWLGRFDVDPYCELHGDA